jgi:hypothetical protein
MVSIQYHILASCIIWAFFYWLYPEIGLAPLVLLILADFILDIDHLYKHKSLSTIAKNYKKTKDYPLHKIWIIFPLAIGAMLTPLYWMGIGWLVHFILDAIENAYIFGSKFKWI